MGMPPSWISTGSYRLLRHYFHAPPESLEWQGTWEEIYHKALEKLPSGRLIITSYFDREHEQAIEVIANQVGSFW